MRGVRKMIIVVVLVLWGFVSIGFNHKIEILQEQYKGHLTDDHMENEEVCTEISEVAL